MMMMIMRHPVALFISTVIGFTIHKTLCLMIELELFCAIAATTVGAIPPNNLFYSGMYVLGNIYFLRNNLYGS